MRIAGGRWRGREVLMPKSEAVRPTQSRVREAVFDLLMQVVGGCRFLDLFAGSGAMGIEALSRGAASVAFWERDRAVFATLCKNLAAFGIPESCACQRDSLLALGLEAAEEAPEAAAGRGMRPSRAGRGAQPAASALVAGAVGYTVVFADPPYRWAQAHGLAPLALALRARGVLSEGGFFVAEMGRGTHPEEIAGFALVRDRLYGTSRIAIWQAEA